MRKRIVFITIVVTLGVLTVGGAVLGATDGGDRDRAARVARISGTSRTPCGTGFAKASANDRRGTAIRLPVAQA